MPPRGVRPRKAGLKRMDAAIDALTPMGFSPDLIRRKVKALLKLYNCDQGWIAIEEASYKLLIECILEEQEQKGELCQQGEPSFRDSPDEANPQCGEEAEPLGIGPSSGASEPLCSNQDTALATHRTDAPSPSPLVVLGPSFSNGENETCPSKIAASNVVNQPNGILVDQDKIAGCNEVYMHSGPPGFEQSNPLQLGFAIGKRKPCFGWIDRKDDKEFVLLEPAPVIGWRTGERPRKRKSRWDVGPNNVV